MATTKTALIVVNDVLKRTGEISGDSGDITSFTDTQRQRAIDVIVQVMNEIIVELYARGALQGEVKSGKITLATDTQEYSLPTDFERMSGVIRATRVLVDPTNNTLLLEYPGGYEQLFINHPDMTDFTGQANYWYINTTNNKIGVDNIPTSAENGDVYNFLYEKEISITAVGDTFPFTDTVVRMITPAIAEMVRLDLDAAPRNPAWASQGFKAALATLTQSKRKRSYGVRRANAA